MAAFAVRKKTRKCFLETNRPKLLAQAFHLLFGPDAARILKSKAYLMEVSGVSGTRNVRIFVVDDNPSVRRHLRGVLEQNCNWRVCDEARNGQEAVDRYRAINPDVIVLDFYMPEMNGLDAARIIARLSPEIPILLVTLYPSRQLSEEARKVGARGACVKADVNSVVDGVQALLREETYFPN